MCSATKTLCLALLLMVSASPLLAQATKPAATQSQPAASQAATSQPDTFETHATLGPALPIPEIEISGKKVCRYNVYGPVWDGVNNGLWIVLEATDSHKLPKDRKRFPEYEPAIALLVDPATGQEKRRLDVPSRQLIGHDGVGLWFQARPRSADGFLGGVILQRVRTAPDLPLAQKEAGRRLPEDLPPSMSIDGFQFSSRVPVPSLFSALKIIISGDIKGTAYLSRWFFDLRAVVLCREWRSLGVYDKSRGSGPGMTTGGDYLWLFTDRLKRFPLSKIEPPQAFGYVYDVSGGPAMWGIDYGEYLALRTGLNWSLADQDTPAIGGNLAWDGQRLWSFEPILKYEVKYIVGRLDRPREGWMTEWVIFPPVRLVSIDVGLTRKPDTTARYNKALAFEKKNGTLKAIPLFEELIASDPAAVEIRNHLGWALGTRPKEPYHDLQRAKMLVESALEWQPWDPEKWDTLAEIYWRLGDAKLAEHLEAKAINLNPAKTFYWKQLDKFRTQPGSDDAPEPAY